jgi:hypothetical protein
MFLDFTLVQLMPFLLQSYSSIIKFGTIVDYYYIVMSIYIMIILLLLLLILPRTDFCNCVAV